MANKNRHEDNDDAKKKPERVLLNVDEAPGDEKQDDQVAKPDESSVDESAKQEKSDNDTKPEEVKAAAPAPEEQANADKPLSPSYVNTLQAVAELHPNASANTIRDVYQANQLTALATHTVLEMLSKLTEYGYVERRMGKPAPDSDTPVEYFDLTTSGRERLAVEREAMRK